MVTEICIEDVFALKWPIIDVRSPGEFAKGHIPGAVNIPLFANDERAHVGTVYKQQSKEKAIEVGYKYVNPKLDRYISESSDVAPDGKVIVHCWRGGMRSRSFAQHLSDNGFTDVKVITAGYKAFRNHVLNQFAVPAKLNILGGFTGSGKTYILDEIRRMGHQVIDLEAIAHHKGSAFGSIGELPQPTSEQFENNLFNAWRKLNFEQPVWIEDESLSIGSVNIPLPLFEQMRAAHLYFIDIPNQERAKHLVTEYTNCDKQLLVNSLQRITKRLGGKNVQLAIAALEEENYIEVALISLHYYDKSYIKGLNKRKADKVTHLSLSDTNHHANALKILKTATQYEHHQVNTI